MKPVGATLARLWRADPEEDRRLDELEISITPAVWFTFHVAVPVLLAAVIYMSIGDVGRRNIPEFHPGSQAIAAVLLALAALPWAVELWRPLPSRIFVPASLGPIGAIGIGRHLGVVNLHQAGADLMPFVVMVIVVPIVIGAPRRVAAITVLSAAGIYVIWNTTPWGYDFGPSWAVMTIWFTALVFASVATAMYRMIVVGMVETREAREQLVHQQTADERRQVARDIHDVVAHTLSVTMLHVTAARMAIGRGASDEAEEALEEAERHGRASLDDVRRIVRLLRADDTTPVDTPQPDLRDVPELVESYQAAGLPVELSLALDDAREPSPAAELATYRVLQEALANATRHGNGPATVNLRATNGDITMRVDNPIDETSERDRRQGSGVTGMRERVGAVGGKISTGPHEGRWVVEAHIPAAYQTERYTQPRQAGWKPLVPPSKDRASNGASRDTGDSWSWHPRMAGPR